MKPSNVSAKVIWAGINRERFKHFIEKSCNRNAVEQNNKSFKCFSPSTMKKKWPLKLILNVIIKSSKKPCNGNQRKSLAKDKLRS